eukprot:scaffold2615_cov188-Prasinococcus_capsulatus_cf.AAC.1
MVAIVNADGGEPPPSRPLRLRFEDMSASGGAGGVEVPAERLQEVGDMRAWLREECVLFKCELHHSLAAMVAPPPAAPATARDDGARLAAAAVCEQLLHNFDSHAKARTH